MMITLVFRSWFMIAESVVTLTKLEKVMSGITAFTYLTMGKKVPMHFQDFLGLMQLIRISSRTQLSKEETALSVQIGNAKVLKLSATPNQQRTDWISSTFVRPALTTGEKKLSIAKTICKLTLILIQTDQTKKWWKLKNPVVMETI